MDELARAQSSLGRALGRARAGEDPALAQQVREGGEQLVQMLFGLLKLTRTHSPDNRAFDAPVAEFGRALASLGQLLGTVHLVTVEDQVYLNDLRVRTEGRGGGLDLGQELRGHNVGGLSFHAPLEAAQIRSLVAALASPGEPEAPRQALAERLRRAGVGSVELAGIFRFSMVRPDAEAPRRAPATVLALLLLLGEEAHDHVAAGRVLNPLPLRRAVLEVLELGIEAPDFWVGSPDCPPHVAHAAEVALTALLLGKAAGLGAGALQELGIAGLLHDVGYQAPGQGSGPEGLARHAIEGARILLRQRGFSEAKVWRLRAVLDHHRDWGDGAQHPSTVGAVLRVAEDYANLVRLYGNRVNRATALGAMIKAAGTLYHPVLPQLLVNALGRYPPGALLELDGRRLGRSAAPARGPELWDRPLVRLLDPATRQPAGALVDLGRGGAVVRELPG